MHHRESAHLLGISAFANELQIRRAYRTLAKKHHPDAGGSSQQFNRITEAYKHMLLYSRKQNGLKDQLYNHGNTILRDPDPGKRLRAVSALSGMKKKGSFGYLKFALGDSDANVVKASIRGITALGLSQGGRELLSLYNKADTVIKQEILFSASKRAGEAEYRKILYAAMADKDPFLKKEAYRIFKVMRSQSGETWEK